MVDDLKARVRSLVKRDAVESELDDELHFHFDAQVAKLEARGHSREEAQRLARLEFGTVDSVKEEHRDARGTRSLETFAQDVKYALRLLKKAPGYAVIAILTLALGIGANAAIFSFVEAWLIKPLPYAQADRLMVLQTRGVKEGWVGEDVPSTADYFDFAQQNTSFEELAIWSNWTYNLTGDGRPDRVDGGRVGWNFFQLLSAQPILGRTFIEKESQPGESHVAILSRGLWESRYAADPNIIGRKITLEGETYTVVGVMAATFQYPIMGIANIWTPLTVDDKERSDRDHTHFAALGRLRAGVTQQQANAEAATFSARFKQLYPHSDSDHVLMVRSMADHIGQNEGTDQIKVAFVVVGLVLLIACANVANLMLARASRRAKEFALRGALGATRTRLVRQLLTESALLFLTGGIGGAIVGYSIVHVIERNFPDHIRGYLLNYGHVSLDLPALLYTLGIAVVCGVIFGLVPAFQSSGIDVNRALKESSGQMSGNLRVTKARRLFVGAQIALAVVVMVCTALLVESFAHMVLDRMGFNSANVMTLQLELPAGKYKTPADVRGFYDQAIARIQALPEVTSAGAGEYIPFSQNSGYAKLHVGGEPPALPGEEVDALFSKINPTYLETMQISVLQGRGIEASDGADAPKVALIGDVLARQIFRGEDPVGRTLEIGDAKVPHTIIGVVSTVKRWSMATQPERQMYVPLAQEPSSDMGIVIRTARPVEALPSAIRSAIWSVDSEEPISLVRTLDDQITEQNTGFRTLTWLFGFFGVLALLLGAIGIYGVMASAVEQRLHEIGIRMALGATRRQVVRMMLRYGFTIAVAGVAVGLVAAAMLSRGLEAILYKVKGLDPVAFAGVGVIFVLVTLAACYIPARRGAHVDPMQALRCE